MNTHRMQIRSATDPAVAGEGGPASIAVARSVEDGSTVATASLSETVRVASGVAAVLTLACGVIAVVVDAGFAAQARRWLAYPFTGIPAQPDVAAGIFLHNLRALAAVVGLLLIAQSAQLTRRTDEPRRAPIDGPSRRGSARGAVAANLIVVGASFGAYGTRMLRAALPQAPSSSPPTRSRSRSTCRLAGSRSRPCPCSW